MANTKKAIFFPGQIGLVGAHVTNIAALLAGATGTKYGTEPGVITAISGHATNIPTANQKAYDDDQVAQNSTALRDQLHALAKTDVNREMNRITALSNWDEADGELLGIRVVKTPVDINTVKPVISKITSLSDKLILDWVRANMEGVFIESLVQDRSTSPDHGTPGTPTPPDNNSPLWEKLAEDDRSPFEDTRLNKSNTPENRYYRLQYKKDNKRVGLYSTIYVAVAEIYA